MRERAERDGGGVDEGRDVGQDYLAWRDVQLTLTGAYGARTTLADEGDPASAVMYVGAAIRELLDGGMPASDVAVLYRVNARSRAVERALRVRRIPYQVVRGVEFFQRAEVKDLVASRAGTLIRIEPASLDFTMRVLPEITKWQKARNYPFSLYTEASVNLSGLDDLMDAMVEKLHATPTVEGEPTATADYVPDLPFAAKYDISLWYPQGGNRTTNAPAAKGAH